MNNPIGFFDSGVGGTSIWKEVKKLLPNEDTVYLCDSKNAPYGLKPKDEIIAICERNTKHLLKFNCKLIVVACNTATTNAISYLREHFNLPFIGIEPAIKPASLVTKNNTIGVLATKGTLESELFEETSGKIKDIEIISREGTGIVELMESGKLESQQMKALLQQHLKPLLNKQIDALVLGCTHYPYLIPQIREIVGNKIQIIDSGAAVARQTKAILEKHALSSTQNSLGFHQILTNGSVEVINQFVARKTNISIRKGIF